MGVPFTLPYRTTPDTLDAVRADLEALLVMADIEAGARFAAEARHIQGRRDLAGAAEQGAAMLDALRLDPVALDALDLAIATLDALDAPEEDMEPWLGHYTPGLPIDGEQDSDDEYSLGWREGVTQTHLGHGQDDGEPTLGAPERSPDVASIHGGHFRYRKPCGSFQRCHNTRSWNQVEWAQGQALDCEGESEPGYDLPEGDDELCGSEHNGAEPEEQEPSLGSPIGDGDQRHWAQGLDGEREVDPCDGPGLVRTLAQCQAARDRRPEMHALARQAFALRRSGRPVDSDAVTPMAPGMVWWRGPNPYSVQNVTPIDGEIPKFLLTEMREAGA